MKKVFLTMLVATALVACNEKPSKVVDGTIEPAPAQVEAATSADSTNTPVAPSADDNAVPAAATQAQQEAAQKMQEIADKSNYTPSGDINKDAQALVDKQLELANKHADGVEDEALKNEVTAMMVKLSNHYDAAGKKDEFQKIMVQKLQEGIARIKAN